jgi:hypothetical protein
MEHIHNNLKKLGNQSILAFEMVKEAEDERVETHIYIFIHLPVLIHLPVF